MQDIETMLLLYSRTANRDYRWIFIDSEIPHEDLNNMLQDFSEQKRKFAQGLVVPPHMYIRRINNGIAFYSIRRTERLDCCGCSIPALEGFSIRLAHALYFCSMIRHLAYDLLHYSPFSVHIPKDKDQNIMRPFTYRLDEKHIEKSNDATDAIAQLVDQYLMENGLGEGFLLTQSPTRGLNINPLSAYQSATAESEIKGEQSKRGLFAKLFKK